MLRLRPDMRVVDAERIMREQAAVAENIANSVWESGDYEKLIGQYLDWLRGVDAHLETITTDQLPRSRLQSPMRFHLQSLSWTAPRAIWSAMEELHAQAALLTTLADELKAAAEWAKRSAGVLAVPDTHVLMHYLPLEQIPWPKVVEAAQVRVVLPIRVVEELDEKKSARRDDLRRRAREVLADLDRLLDETEPAPIGEDATVEVLLRSLSGPRLPGADDEVLECVAQLSRLGVGDAVVLTGDSSMRIKARAAHLVVAKVPDQYLRQRDVRESEQ